MEVTISRTLSPETEKALQALQTMVDNGDVNISDVVTAYDIIYLIIFAAVAIPIFIWAIRGLIGSVNEIVQGNKEVKMANRIINAANASKETQAEDGTMDFAPLLDALAQASSKQQRKSGSTQQAFQDISRQIAQAIKQQRRKTS